MMAKRGKHVHRDNAIKNEDQLNSTDQISTLPDDLLLFILSFLTFKEAIATSILSCRWRYLWTFIPTLNFDGTESLVKANSAKVAKQEALLDQERGKYVRWVNNFLALYKNSSIEEFRVFFNLTKTSTKTIDQWLQYVLTRKVKRLELNLIDEGTPRSRNYDEVYTFPYELLRHTVPYSSDVCTRSVDFKNLQSILMNWVNVNGQALEFLLCNCPLLEHLSVSQSIELSSLKVSGPFHSLKRLEISFCFNLKSIEIRDTNLIYFKYEGDTVDLLLENLPMLVEVFIGGSVTRNMKNVLSMLSSYLPRLEIFTIEKHPFSWEETAMFYSNVKMSNLKQLVVKTEADGEDFWLLCLTNLILASPCLQKFVLETCWCEPRIVKRKVNKVETSSYFNLKEVEFAGYYGRRSDLELVMHFLENAHALEKLVIDPRDTFVTDCYQKDNQVIKMENAARIRAHQQLKNKVPPGINWKVL